MPWNRVPVFYEINVVYNEKNSGFLANMDHVGDNIFIANEPLKGTRIIEVTEIVSPGSLPNSLTIENVKMGNAVVRNNLLVSFCSKLMNYRGFGSGISRALEHQPDMELINEVDGELFKVIISRPEN